MQAFSILLTTDFSALYVQSYDWRNMFIFFDLATGKKLEHGKRYLTKAECLLFLNFIFSLFSNQ